MTNGIIILLILIVLVALTTVISKVLEISTNESIGKGIGKSHFKEMGFDEKEQKMNDD